MLTLSEEIFERYCHDKGIFCNRIPEGNFKTPDYLIKVDLCDILIEIKQLDENENDKRINGTLRCGGSIVMAGSPVDRVRSQIASGYKQIKSYNKQGYPAGIVLYNNAGPLAYIDDWTITKSMFGEYGYKICKVESGASFVGAVGAGFFGGRKLTRNTCRALSFVAVMKKNADSSVTFKVYHNPFAAAPLPKDVLANIATSQLVHNNPHEGKWVRWEPDGL